MIKKVAAIIVLVMVALLSLAGCVSNTTPATPTYQFTTGTAPPQAVSDLLRYGTAVLLINQRNCTACEEANPKFADLQTQYKDTDVRFATFNVNDNSTSAHVALAYAVNSTPTMLIIRKDGAFAKITVPPPYPSTALIDLNTVKSAIDDAQKWQSLNPTATVATPTPSADYSSYFNTAFTSGNAIVVQPFTKGTNNRGNAVYKGVTRNSSLPASQAMTNVIELTQSQADAKQLYDQTVAQKLSEGFTAQPNAAALFKAGYPFYTEVWIGVSQQTGQVFYVMYYSDSHISPSWLFMTEAGGAGG